MKGAVESSRVAALVAALALCAAGAGAAEEDEGAPVIGHLQVAFAAAAKKVAAAVVAIEVDRGEREGGAAEVAGKKPAEPSPARSASKQAEPAYSRRPTGAVSGVSIGRGRVLTSAWNVQGARRIVVRGPEGEAFEARVLGRDEAIDLALLAVEGEGGGKLRALTLADARAAPPPVGSFVVAVGRGPLGTPVVNAGIVSALGRFRGEAMQTDAALNYGNYGGAVTDIEGRLVGIAVRVSAKSGVNSGVGFVIPVGRAREVLPRLERNEPRPVPRRPFLGVRFGRELPEAPGVEVAAVVPGSAADEAGIEQGDILRRIEGVRTTDASAIAEALEAHAPGDVVRIEVERDGHALGLEATLGERTETKSP